MPIFEYDCQNCGHNFERIVFSGEKEQVTCPKCKSDQVKRVISSTSFIVQGAFSAGSSGCNSSGFS